MGFTFELLLEVETEKEDYSDVTGEELIANLEKKLEQLKKMNSENARKQFNCTDVFGWMQL